MTVDYTVSRLETSTDGNRFIRLDGGNVHFEKFFTTEDDEQAIIEECVAELEEKAKEYVAPPEWEPADDTVKATLIAKVRPNEVAKIQARLTTEKVTEKSAEVIKK